MALDAAAFSLLDALAETGFQSSVIATYCCYFPFYEEVVLRRLLDRGCTNNILMVDTALCAEAFANEDIRPRRAGRDYTLVPVDLRGAFHPKLIVTLGKAKGALFVGSHNATLAGFGLNDEVTNVFRSQARRSACWSVVTIEESAETATPKQTSAVQIARADVRIGATRVFSAAARPLHRRHSRTAQLALIASSGAGLGDAGTSDSGARPDSAGGPPGISEWRSVRRRGELWPASMVALRPEYCSECPLGRS